ncbi:unnamed protein product [Pseudo-nitzschia multistriata]|uniref:Endonuclease n=1 Tax=Pseudo-nitzschia multistriata TaxID=183589 RepID=A0A448ZGU0_9STRA|nr:unnamed protein product [Pseudo-nitzschia multistriata]
MFHGHHRRALSVAAGAAAAHASSWLSSRGASNRSETSSCEGIPSAGPNHNAPVAMGCSDASPVLPIRTVRPNPHLEIAFDVRTRTPLYVMEKLTKATLPERGSGGGRKRRPNFYEDKNVEGGDFRSRLSHYHKSGFDRGHMAPGADFPGETTADTYTLCNIAPQDPVMNKGIWNSLEEWVRRLVHSEEVPPGADVYVVTGPLWLPRKQVGEGRFEYRHLALGRPPALVSVPTHFWKVVVVVERDAPAASTGSPILRFACFVIGNEEASPSKKLEDYVVPWKDLETVTGLRFFPKWASPEWKDRADQLTKARVPASLGSNSSRLFLTDRSAKTRNPKSGKVLLEHLCANGKCR